MDQLHSTKIGIISICAVILQLFQFRFTWRNFTEAGHGKGPADGVGAAIKRLTDKCVLSSQDITDTSSLKCALESLTEVKLFLVNEFVTLSANINIPAFPGTMKTHQLLAECTGRVSYCPWSCYCSATQMCSCIKPQTVNVGHSDKSGVTLRLPSFETNMPICSQIEETDVTNESSTATIFTEYSTT